jgi:raffinose/stachyose/melibiose transport system permease protein
MTAERLSPTNRTARRLRTTPGGLFARVAIGALVAFVLFIVVYPLVWLVLASLKGPDEFTFSPVYALPAGLYFQNYVDAFVDGHIGTYFLNSILVVFPSLAVILILSVSAAFALEVMRWRGRDGLLLVFIAGILVPTQMLLLPLFTMYFKAGILDSRWSLLVTYVGLGLPLSIFLMAGYFKAVPRELMEAAILDGATLYQAFYRVALPMVANAIVTVALIQFFFLWNDLLFALTFISSDENKTIQTGLLSFVGERGQVDWGPTFAAISLAVFPTLILYLILNQRIIKGLTAGALKG